jgi:RNA polymerase sigma-70 factor (ECF subfamily)
VHSQDAEDIVQDAFATALRHGHGFRYQAKPSTWLHRIVVNACISHHRTLRVRTARRLRQPKQPPLTNAGFLHNLAVRRALRLLRRSDYRVFVMYEVMGYTHPEIAALLSIPEGTSKWTFQQPNRLTLGIRTQCEYRCVIVTE